MSWAGEYLEDCLSVASYWGHLADGALVLGAHREDVARRGERGDVFLGEDPIDRQVGEEAGFEIGRRQRIAVVIGEFQRDVLAS